MLPEIAKLVFGGSMPRLRLVSLAMAGIAALTLLAESAWAVGRKTQVVLYNAQSAEYYIDVASSYVNAHDEVHNETGLNTTYFEIYAGSIQCNGYGQNCIVHASTRQYGTLYDTSFREADAGNPYSFGHVYKACVSHKTQYSNSTYNWTYLNQCTALQA
jgi:predicted small secreted protein